ncbi:MAG TPA: ATP phosphoribosyltransferase regulatory subunit [Clostridiales bacterium]|nr:ATP phosphoribosyltransferase regulatory subunit [Clostridiales bacterium]
MITESLLKKEEKAILELRALYRAYGYLPYKMNKFEEYDFYAKNKDFLVSDGIISFTDTNGKLMALKPDVTLSIIKNYKEEPGCIQRVYYNENVYRIAGDTHEFKEIMQTGLECMGDLDDFAEMEVITLALKSLQAVSKDFVLEISHMGFLAALLEAAEKGEDFNKKAMTFVGEKNQHELKRLCKEYQVSPEMTEKLESFIGIYGERQSVLRKLEPLSEGNAQMEEALRKLQGIDTLLRQTGFSDAVRFDFSLVNDMNYYDGLVFQGFVSGIPEVILSGGQYDRLMHRCGYRSGGMGFALYLDLLEYVRDTEQKYDVDAVLLYEDGCNYSDLKEMLRELASQNYTVSVQKGVPTGISYRKLLKFNGKGVEVLENHD